MTDKEILTKAIEIIGEFSDIDEQGNIIQSYANLIEQMKKMMNEVGFDEE